MPTTLHFPMNDRRKAFDFYVSKQEISRTSELTFQHRTLRRLHSPTELQINRFEVLALNLAKETLARRQLHVEVRSIRASGLDVEVPRKLLQFQRRLLHGRVVYESVLAFSRHLERHRYDLEETACDLFYSDAEMSSRDNTVARSIA